MFLLLQPVISHLFFKLNFRVTKLNFKKKNPIKVFGTDYRISAIFEVEGLQNSAQFLSSDVKGRRTWGSVYRILRWHTATFTLCTYYRILPDTDVKWSLSSVSKIELVLMFRKAGFKKGWHNGMLEREPPQCFITLFKSAEALHCI